jgi:hypothetical protein
MRSLVAMTPYLMSPSWKGTRVLKKTLAPVSVWSQAMALDPLA